MLSSPIVIPVRQINRRVCPCCAEHRPTRGYRRHNRWVISREHGSFSICHECYRSLCDSIAAAPWSPRGRRVVPSVAPADLALAAK